MAYNPIGEGLAGLGQGIGAGLQQRRQETRLRGLLERVQGGDAAAVPELAAVNPGAATAFQNQQALAYKQEQAQQEKRIKDVGIIANTALGIQDPVQRRAYLIERMQAEQDPEIKAEIADSLNMDDDQLAYDLQEAVTQVRGIPEPQKMSSIQQKVVAAGLDPNTPEGQAYARRLLEKESGTNVNIDLGAGKEAETLAKNRADRYDAFQQEAFEAADANAQLDQLESMDVKTGFGEDMKAGTARVFKGLGIPGAEALLGTDITNVQSFNAVSGQLLSQALSQQKGPQTDQDAARIQKTLPNIGNEELANDFILSSLRAMNLRKQERADFYTNFLEENDTLKGADRAWREFMRETPLVSDSVRNPDTGLPMFFYEFRDKFAKANPGAPESVIIEQWRKLARK